MTTEESAAAAVASARERILSQDRAGDTSVRAVCTVIDTAAETAAELDAERTDGRVRGPLHGLPILLKDNLDTAGVPTTAGSLALAPDRVRPPVRDAALVTRLREAGTVAVGKANLSEWANFRGERSSSGWSGYGGLTRNPWAHDRSAGGSSSGSAAAVAAGYVTAAIGSETNGSIVCPAALCGVVGVKPTVGVVPGDGVVPIAHSQDTAGPIATDVLTAARLLDAMAGTDAYARACLGADGLHGARLGLPRRSPLWGYHDRLDEVVERAVAAMVAAGADVVDDLVLPGSEDEAQLLVLQAELHDDLGAYLAERSAPGAATIADVVAFNREHADAELGHFGQEHLEAAVANEGRRSEGYVEARHACLAATVELDRLLAAHELDAVVMPTYPPAWSIDLVNGDAPQGGCPDLAAYGGYPLVTVPAGFVDGLPVGVCFGAGARSDATLIRLAHAYEALRTAADGPFPTAHA